jgi:hypothetical protein
VAAVASRPPFAQYVNRAARAPWAIAIAAALGLLGVARRR